MSLHRDERLFHYIFYIAGIRKQRRSSRNIYFVIIILSSLVCDPSQQTLFKEVWANRVCFL